MIIAIAPNRFGDGEGWLDHSEAFFAEMLKQDGVRLPGGRRHAERARIPKEGFHIPGSLHEKILALTNTK